MQMALKEDPVGVTLTFDGQTNIKNKQLLGVVVIISEGRPYIWKVDDISSKREIHYEIIEKIIAIYDY